MNSNVATTVFWGFVGTLAAIAVVHFLCGPQMRKEVTGV